MALIYDPARYKPDHVEVRRFLDLFAQDDKIHLVAIKPHWGDHQEKSAPGDLFVNQDENWTEALAFIDRYQAQAWGIYFTINPLKHRVTKKASDDDVLAGRYLCRDSDPKGDAPYADKRKALLNGNYSKIQEEEDPTFIVDSGHGLQVLVRLREPVSNIEEFKRVNEAYIDWYGGDAVHDPSRVFRLPGTWNWPSEKKVVKDGYPRQPVPSKLLYANPSADHPFINFQTQFPITAVDDAPPALDFASTNLSERRQLVAGADGDRSSHQMSVICEMLMAHATESQIRAAAMAEPWGERYREGRDTFRYDIQKSRAFLWDQHVSWYNGARSHFNIATKRQEIALAEFNLSDWTANAYQGAAPAIQWMCKDSIPLGIPMLFAAMGGLGKSYLALDLALSIAVGVTNNLTPKNVLGGEVMVHGTAVVLSAEDSKDSIHRRINAIDPLGFRFKHPEKLIVVPMPNVGGPKSLIGKHKEEFKLTEFFGRLLAQLKAIPDLKLVVIDPAQAFMSADINTDPAAGQFMWSALATMCAETGATVILAHHMKKDGGFAIETIDQAREAIRGSTALVDGARLVYAMWKTPEDKAMAVCNSTGIDYEDGRIVQGAVVKANDKTNKEVEAYVRQESGVLTFRGAFKSLIRAASKLPASAKLTSKQLEKLAFEVEDKWLTKKPYSRSANSDRWLGSFMRKEFNLREAAVKQIIKDLLDDEIIYEEIYNQHDKTKGLRASGVVS